jgi:hypothetical protein
VRKEQVDGIVEVLSESISLSNPHHSFLYLPTLSQPVVMSVNRRPPGWVRTFPS